MSATLKRSLWVGIGVIVALGALVAPLALSQQKVSAGHDDKVKICHRNNNPNQPYGPKAIEVDDDAVDGRGSGDHYKQHEGPIASSAAVAQTLKNSHIEWGDIIPPVPGKHGGLNWNPVGKAMWANDCQFAKVATANVYTEPATCKKGEVLRWGAISNATFSGTPNGTTGGPTNYSVTATAQVNALFNNADATKQFTGTLAGKIPSQNTNPTGACYVTVPDATAVVTIVPATCDAAEKLVWGAISNATFSGTANNTFGPGSYNVTATANVGHTFVGGALTMNFSGSLADKIPAQSVNPQGNCFTPPELEDTVVRDEWKDGEILCDATTVTQTRTVTTTPRSWQLVNGEWAIVDGTPVITEETQTRDLSEDEIVACPPEEVDVATAGVEVLDATCEVGETLKYVDVQNASATAESTIDGTVGPTAYSVTFVANPGAAFAPEAESTFSGTLAGPIAGDDCVLGTDTDTGSGGVAPTGTPAVLPATTGESTAAIVLGGSLFAVVFGLAGARRILARSL